MPDGWPNEHAFELDLCARLEARTDTVVARQLGGGVAAPGRRIVDVVTVAPGRAFDDRARITAETIPPAVVEGAARVDRAVPAADAAPVHPERRGALLDRAVDVGFLERRAERGAARYRRTVPYPDDWFGDLVAVENKPDLSRPGDLRRQLRHDVSLGLFDRVVLATASHVTGAHLNRIPDAVGVWRVHTDDTGWTVVRGATPLRVSGRGVEPVARDAGRVDVALPGAAAKRRARRRVAERAYGRGWRPDPADAPACARYEPADDGRPRCAALDRVVDPAAACGPDCPERAPADPPAVDPAAHRDARTPWVRDPAGVPDGQAGLDRFG